MKLILSILMLTAAPSFVLASDDAAHNPIAKKLKNKLLKELATSDLKGFCDVFVELKHTDNYAIVASVTTTGDYRLCKVGKTTIKKGLRFKYRTPEKYLRIHVAN